jgi:translation initiation factor IF-2
MTDQTEKPNKPLSLSTTTRSGSAAKGGGETQVRQKFSHGRTRNVTVEVKKPVKRPPGAPAPVAAASAPAPAPAPSAPAPAAPGRTLKLGGGGAPAPATARTPSAAPSGARPTLAPRSPAPSGGARGGGLVLKTLTEEEKKARMRVLGDANRQAEVARQRAVEDAKRREVEEKVRHAAEEDHRRRLAEEEARKKAEEEMKRKADALVQKRMDQAEAAPETPMARQVEEIGVRPPAAAPVARAPSAPPSPRPSGPGGSPRPSGPMQGRPVIVPRPPGSSPPSGGPGGIRRPPMRPPMGPPKRPTQAPGARREAPKRRSDKVDVGRAVAGENDFRSRSVAQQRRRLDRERRREFDAEPQQKVYREVTIPEVITVQELAQRMAERGGDVIKTLMGMGVMATINQAIDPDTAELVVTEMGHRFKRVTEGDVETGLTDAVDPENSMVARPPVVTIMGHVDHGKTSLLDALRATDVAAHEAGGITQHIGAYQVTLPSKQKITFLDTPGHAAFTAMRARGAEVTDIVVLVVAGDDGVMPQTKEAIAHAKAAGVPIIVAINKMDKPGADASRVQNELLRDEIQVEQLGGEVQSIEVSATKKMNLDKLEEAILLQAEVLELKANPNRAADGVVIEAKLDPGRGSVATVLVQKGTLKVGDVLVAGAVWGRVRRLVDDRGQQVEEAGPAFPVEILGLAGTPQAGDEFHVVESEARAREIADFRARRDRQVELARAAGGRGTLEEMMKGIREGTAKELPVLIKADVQGSAEALAGALSQLGNDKVVTRVVYSGVGGISEADMTLAKASGALIIGFNVRANPQAREIAKRDKVDIRYYSIIYKVTEDMEQLMVGLLDPTYKETFLGNAQIREVFRITKVGNVAGCMITEGMVKRGAKVRLLRDNVVIHEGTLKTLRRFKDEVREVQHGFECGMAFENYDDIKVGDVIECFDVEEVKPSL